MLWVLLINMGIDKGKREHTMKREQKQALWEEYLKVVDFPEQQKGKLKELGILLLERVSYLYKIYSLSEEKTFLEDEETGIVYEAEEDLHILRKGNMGIFLKKEEMKCLLADMISLFEEILPLGTVVDLKKGELAKTMDVSKVQQFRVIITKRFIGVGTGCFYPYGAVVYPLGTAGNGRTISFTPSLIENIVFTGYGDEVEEEFVFQMKKHLIVEQRRKSVGFATKQEREELEKVIHNLEGQHGR